MKQPKSWSTCVPSKLTKSLRIRQDEKSEGVEKAEEDLDIHRTLEKSKLEDK